LSGRPRTARWARPVLGGPKIGPNPTDRGKNNGVKRSLLLLRPQEQKGTLSVVIAGANVADFKLLEATLEAVVIERPQPSQSAPQHLCASTKATTHKGPALEEAVEFRHYTSHIRRIGEEKLDEVGEKRYPARRWVVERTLGWLSKCRAILIRYEKKAVNYLGFIKVACILLWYRRQHRLSLLR
jgi:putative transposase